VNPAALEYFPSVTPIQVAWGDMDAFGHVNNTCYFRYFETARIAYFERAGVLDGSIGPILASTSCRFRAPVTFPDTVLAAARVLWIDDDRFQMEHVLWSEALQTIAARGDALIVSYDYVAKAKAPMPPAWVEAIARLQGALPPRSSVQGAP
jgi:acyl-CoA thioester hydrolase